MKTVLFSFPDIETRDQFLADLGKVEAESVKNVIDHVRLDPPIKSNDDRTVALFVSGSRLEEGPLTKMNERFEQEIDAHSGSVYLKELRGGEWVNVRSRASAG